MKAVYAVSKDRGETLSVLLSRFKKAHPGLKDESLTYAGRLDPMAEGLVLLLAGDTVHEKAEYTALDKEYDIEILFGFRSDTGDVLGELVDAPTRKGVPRSVLARLPEAVAALVGTHTDPYPAYSSKPVAGVPLFEWAKAGKLEDIEIPEHAFEVMEAGIVGMREITSEALLADVTEGIGKVAGDFRQERILTLWQEHTRTLYDLTFPIVGVRVRCSSGTYMRSLAEKVGATLGVPALAFRIRRTRIGEHSLKF